MEPEECLSLYEQQRAARIEANNKQMRELGVLKAQAQLHNFFKVSKRPLKKSAQKKKGEMAPTRASARLAKEEPEFEGLVSSDDDETSSGISSRTGTARFTARAAEPLSEAQEVRRCQSQARGSLYDSVAGICCHFCRQKKLCGEEGCQRCSQRDPDLPCLGKSECSRCQSGRGRFCRACLLVRYGEDLLEVRRLMASEAGWLCPHCVEEEHPEKAWICNSSICMKLRGMKPTGIAIFEAQKRGFPSVAHLVQAELRAKNAFQTKG